MAGQGGLGQRRGQEGLRHLGDAAALPPGGLARPHLAGGRAVDGARKRPACTCSARSSSTAVPRDDQRRPRLLHLPRDRPDASAPTRSTRRSTASDVGRSPRTRRARKALLEVPRHRRGGRHRPTTTADAVHRRPTTGAEHRRRTTRCRRSRPSSSATAKRSPSSSTATPADFANTVMIPSLQEFIKNPNDIDGLTATSRSRRSRSSELTADDGERATSMAVAPPAPRQTAPPDAGVGAEAARRRRGPASWSSADGRSSRRCSSLAGLAARRWPRWSCPSPTGTASAARHGIELVGTQNYEDIATIYPPFWPAIRHNLIWLVFLFVCPTILGMFLAVLLDREMRGSRFYQTALLHAGRAVAGAHRLHLAAVLLPRPGPAQRRSSAPTSTGTATRTSTCGRCWSPTAGGTPATSC